MLFKIRFVPRFSFIKWIVVNCNKKILRESGGKQINHNPEIYIESLLRKKLHAMQFGFEILSLNSLHLIIM